MNPTLLEDVLRAATQRYLGLGMALQPALDRAAQELLGRSQNSRTRPAETFCIRAMLRGARDKISRGSWGK